MAGGRTYLIAGGILLVGGAAGLAYWLYARGRQPRAALGNIYLQPVSNGIAVRAEVRNVGRAPGYFKIQAIIVSPDCPYQGSTGYPPAGGSNWTNIVNWIQPGQPGWGRGVWAGYEPGRGWNFISPGGTRTLETPAVVLPKGTYNVYVNVAVSKDGTSEGRLPSQEYYRWATGYRI